jgi:hypothetical protein
MLILKAGSSGVYVRRQPPACPPRFIFGLDLSIRLLVDLQSMVQGTNVFNSTNEFQVRRFSFVNLHALSGMIRQ